MPGRQYRVLLLVLSTVLCLLAAEAAVRVFDLFAAARAAVTAAAATAEEAAPAAAGEWPEPRLVLHPYRAWMQRPGTDAGMDRYWRGVFAGGEPPAWTLERREVGLFGAPSQLADLRALPADAVVVAVFGGSVADQLVLYAGDHLLAALSRERPELAGRLELVSMAGPAYKQPQQLQALIELALHDVPLDLVVNLDGLNEVAEGGANARHGVHPYFPDWRRWTAMLELASGAPAPRALALQARILELSRANAALAASVEDTPGLRASALARAVAGAVLLRRQRRIEGLEEELAGEAAATWQGHLAEFPHPCLGTKSGCWELIADQWAEASLLMAAVARQRGAGYAHFLQPNQYVPGSKPLGRKEDLIAHWPGSRWEASVLPGYAALRSRGPALAAEGIAFRDLTQLFRERTEILYVDNCCHLNRRGYELVAEAMVEVVAPLVAPPPAAPAAR